MQIVYSVLVFSDVENVVEKLYGDSPDPLILIGHRYVISSHLYKA